MSDEREGAGGGTVVDDGQDQATQVVGTEQEAAGYRTELMTGLAGSEPASLLDRLELPIEVRFGKLEWELERVLGLQVGEAVPIGPERDDSVTLYVQGSPYAVGDLVVVDGRFGFRVRELLRND